MNDVCILKKSVRNEKRPIIGGKTPEKKISVFIKPFLYLIAVGINRGMPFLLIPILTKHLTPEEYGYLGLASIIVSILKVIIGLSPSLFVITNFNILGKDQLAKSIFQIIVVVVCTFLFSLILLTVFSDFFASKFGINIRVLTMLAVTASLLSIDALILIIIQMRKDALVFFLFSVLSALLQYLMTIIMVVYLGKGWVGKVFGDLLVTIIFVALLMLYLWRRGYVSSKYNSVLMKKFLRFSLPLMPHVVSLWGLNFVDRFFLARMVSIEAVGYYTVAYTIGMGLMLFYDSLQRTWQPYFYEYLAENDHQKRIQIIKFTWLYYLGCIGIYFISVGIIQRIVPLFVGEQYQLALKFIPLIFLGYTFHGMYRAVAGYLYFSQRTSLLSLITVSAVILNAILNYWLIQRHGAIGAAEATAYTFLYSFVVVQLASMKVYHMPWFGVAKKNLPI